MKELDISYDWTYTTDYKGTLQRLARAEQPQEGEPELAPVSDVRVEVTQERIDMEKLKEREPILWFADVPLYEDELHDHGVSAMSVKMVRAGVRRMVSGMLGVSHCCCWCCWQRVMPSGFYVLARYWMRLDHVVVRLHETRVHHLFGTGHFLREYTRKEETFENLFALSHSKSMANYTNIDTFQHLLPVREAVYEKVWLAE